VDGIPARQSRRAFLRSAALALAAPLAPAAAAALASAAGPARASELNRFRVAQLTTGDRPPARPNAALVLAQEVRFRTSVEVKLDRVVLPLSSRAIFDHPFLLWIGDGAFPPLTDDERDRLRAYVQSGGFLLVDNAGDGAGRDAFDRRFRAELRRALPGADLQPVPASHVLLRAFYRLSSVWGRRTVRPYLEGVSLDGRLALVYSWNDLSGAWSRDGFGNWEFEAVPGGPAQREEALRTGVNLVMYSLLLDYKDEQAHVEYLLRHRRLRPEDLEER
jgi:hypothetical protein